MGPVPQTYQKAKENSEQKLFSIPHPFAPPTLSLHTHHSDINRITIVDGHVVLVPAISAGKESIETSLVISEAILECQSIGSAGIAVVNPVTSVIQIQCIRIQS